MDREVSVGTLRQVKSRRAAREAAFVGIYMMDVGCAEPGEAVLDVLSRDHFSREAALYIETVIRGNVDNKWRIDGLISQHLAKGWDLDRIAVTDRCALRVAVYELLFEPEMPPKVTINEAVNLAKRYGTTENGKFVNGLLGKLVQRTDKAKWDPNKYEPYISEPETKSAPEPVFETDEEKEAYEEMTATMPWTLKVPEVKPLD